MPNVTRIKRLQSVDVADDLLRALGERIQLRKKANSNIRSLDFQSWKELAELGFWRTPIPRTLGGEGGTWEVFGHHMRRLAVHSNDLGFLLSVIAHAGLIRLLVSWGSDEQQREYLDRLCDGAIGATAITEVNAGSDIQGITTCATPSPGGFSVNGQKVHITNGPCADIFLLVCRVPATIGNGISLFIIDSNTHGVDRGACEIMMGNHTSPTGPISFADVFVRKQQLIGSLGQGLKILYRTIALDRALYAIACAGILENVLEESFRHCRTRFAFSKPILENQYVQKRLTDVKIAIETSFALGSAALSKIDLNDPEAVLSGSLAKLIATESLVKSAEHFMVLHGHHGYEQGPMTNLMADALGTRIAGGTSDIQRVAIFDQMLRTRRSV